MASSRFRGFSRKKHQNARGFMQEFLWSGKRYQPAQRLKRRDKSCGLHLKEIFLLGDVNFL